MALVAPLSVLHTRKVNQDGKLTTLEKSQPLNQSYHSVMRTGFCGIIGDQNTILAITKLLSGYLLERQSRSRDHMTQST